MAPDLDSAAFVRTLTAAEAATAEAEWPKAARLWQEVVSANPVEGRFWSRLGEALRHTTAYRESVAAYQQAFVLGDFFPAETLYAMAACQALAGEANAAVSTLEQAVSLGLRDLEKLATDEDLASLRVEPRLRDLVGLIDHDAFTRDQGWSYDLRFLVREMERRAYAQHRYAAPAAFEALVAELDAAIPNLSDLQIVMEMNRVLGLLRDGHAYVWPAEADESFQRSRLPIACYWFEEGLFITAASEGYATLLGGQILRVGDHPVAEALATIDSIVHRDGDNDLWVRHMTARLLRTAPLLHALGLTADPQRVSLTIQTPDGAMQEVELQAENTYPRDIYSPSPPGWRSLAETLPPPLPFYLRHQETAYWFTHLPGEQTIYCQFNAVEDAPGESLADFSQRLCQAAEDPGVERLVLDIRFNSGGNTFLLLPLVHGLIGSRLNRQGSLFAIIGRKTFSAAQNFTGFLAKHTRAIFVGEPTGSTPTFIGESVEFTLPYSKARANVSDLLWQSTWPIDYRRWIAPTLYTPPTFAAYRTNRDPAMDAILALTEHLPGW